ncbi:MAG: LPS export ABC transporter periplasmic protein LptC [Bacteroidota bacterium]
MVLKAARILFPYSLVSLFLIALLSCENDIEKVRLFISPEKTPVETAKDVELVYSDSARLKMKMTAPEMNRYESPKEYIEMPRGVVLLFYDDSGQVNSQLTANYAIRHQDNGKMEAKNNVIVVNNKGERLDTEHLIWDEEKQKLYTKSKVTITTADEVLKGDGLESNRDFTEYRILKPSGSMMVEDSTLHNND